MASLNNDIYFEKSSADVSTCLEVPHDKHISRIDDNEIYKCVKWIEDNKYEKIGLQFPDDWLNEADKIVLKIQQKLSIGSLFILCDSSYSSCCVDEISAAHVCADSIIHFGPACLSPFDRLPILYVFQNRSLDIQQLANSLSQCEDRSQRIILIYDVSYAHLSDWLFNSLSSQFPNIVLAKLMIPGVNEYDNSNESLILNGRSINLLPGTSESDYSVVYIGSEGLNFTNFLMILNKCKFYRYDVTTGRLFTKSGDADRSLRKRVHFIEKAKNAKIVGLLVGTLGVSGYVEIIERLKAVGKQAGKKMYTIAVGRLNPNKLANFPEIDAYVLVACWENTLLDSKDFFQPIITPFEFELACNKNREWSGNYITDFRQFLTGGKHFVDLPESVVEMDQIESSGSLIPSQRTVAEIHLNAGGEFLSNRSWQGLEPKIGENEAVSIIDGHFGIASKYDHEINK